MATAPETTNDELRDLIAKGWTPPAEVLEPYRHLLRPFYDARGWRSLPSSKLDKSDIENIAALIAVFEHFGIAIPAAATAVDEPAPWVTVLRAYVAENDGFTTEDAIEAVGWTWGQSTARTINDQLEHMGLSSIRMHSDNTTKWTKRRAA